MSDPNHGAGGSYIRKPDGSLELAGRTEPAPERKPKEATAEETAAPETPAPEAKASKKKEA